MNVFGQKIVRLGLTFFLFVGALVTLSLMHSFFGMDIARMLYLPTIDMGGDVLQNQLKPFADEIYHLAWWTLLITGGFACAWVLASAFVFRPATPAQAERKLLWSSFVFLAAAISAFLFYKQVFWGVHFYSPVGRYALGGVLFVVNLLLFWLASSLFTWRPLRPAVPAAGWCSY